MTNDFADLEKNPAAKPLFAEARERIDALRKELDL